MKPKIRQITANAYTLQYSKKSAALVTFGAADAAYSAPSGGGNTRGDFVPWGAKNDQLAKMHALASESPNKWRLIKTRRDFVAGLGVYAHMGEKSKEAGTRFVEVFSEEFEAWKEEVEFDLEFVSMCLQYAFSGNVFLKFTFDTSKKLVGIEVIDAFKVRIRGLKPGEKKVSAYLVNPNFGTKNYKPADTEPIPAFDPKDPAKYGVCILHLKDRLPGQDYYAFADWWSTEEWSKVANKIPKFHDSGLDNGYNVKYHISIPDNYFDKEGLSDEEKEDLKEDTLQGMAETFAGVENVDKVLVTFHSTGLLDGKAMPGVQIKPLENKMSDDAYTTLFNTANVAQASGHGVLPALAGIDTGGKLGGSGKELEAAANYQQGFLTYVDRLILLYVLKVAKRVNGWDSKLQFDIRNIALYTYDVTPGAAKQNGQNQKTEGKDDNAD
ncbi:hypothetical protein [Siphonobacter sp. SORGH_AS_1065]|uniref:hypothetical protein n=1 Tax=Siphonobacter sp. SORGH_AS_1065 TaxID=3041795 RepID=UPI00277D96D0|nr:hypothetical protein [Siphonobacter sp. SORGH_AS_1065]MDQ1088995.1 hypothetical protein [Siphonobacter sp. SORGH_AS_1065]